MPLGNPDANADQSQRYFADGLTEALIADMGETGVGRVISRTSAMKVAHRAGTPREIARELGVDGVLEGTVSRRAGTGDVVSPPPRRRDRARSLGGEPGAPARETSALVGIVAAAVAAGMHHALTEEAARRLLVGRAVAPDVHEAYLKGRYHWNQRTEASLRTAIDYYQSALRMDSTYAPAEAALADCYNQLGTVMVGTGSPAGFRPMAAAAAIGRSRSTAPCRRRTRRSATSDTTSGSGARVSVNSSRRSG